MHRRNPGSFIYSKATGHVKNFSRFYRLVDTEEKTGINPLGHMGNTLISVIHPEKIIEYRDNNRYADPSIGDQLAGLGAISPFGNPVLVLYEVKSF